MGHAPLSAQIAVGRLPALKEPKLVKGPAGILWLIWLEQRPAEQGRTTAIMRRFGEPDSQALELTPAPINLRSRVHDYGGGVLATASADHHLHLVWIDAGCLWQQRLIWTEAATHPHLPNAETHPLRLTSPGEWELADGLINLQRHQWIGIRERDGKDELVSVDLDRIDQEPELLHQPADFAGYASLNPQGDRLAWVEWTQTSMPWDSSSLWCAELTKTGQLINPSQRAGGRGVSVFQPQWLPDGRLLVAEDSSGWWNLMLGDLATESWERPWPMAAETAMPQWIYGMRTTAWDGERLLAATCSEGTWTLQRLGLDGTVEQLEQPFNDLAGLQACDGRAVAIASNSTCLTGLLELDLRCRTTTWRHTAAAPSPLSPEQISVAKPLWFQGHNQQQTHSWYYPPIGGGEGPAPLLVKSHSGPTAMARCGLSLAIQYWTSRGWGVVDVNYGGSTGFGRAYRERLNGGWGIVDVADCAAAAQALIASGQAHPDHVAIEGGSAGGFTTLAALCFTDVFRAGACRYAVCDLTAMATETHRFEARYLDTLVGDWPAERSSYDDRSPLQHADHIRCPVLFFQGQQDKVVPAEQTERMATALRNNGVTVDVRLFENEGHGFRNQATQITVLEETEAFFKLHLGLEKRQKSKFS